MFCLTSEELRENLNASNQRITFPKTFAFSDADSLSDDSSCASTAVSAECGSLDECLNASVAAECIRSQPTKRQRAGHSESDSRPMTFVRLTRA